MTDPIRWCGVVWGVFARECRPTCVMRSLGGVRLIWMETARSRRSIGPASLASDPIRAGFGEAHSASDVNEGLGDALTSM